MNTKNYMACFHARNEIPSCFTSKSISVGYFSKKSDWTSSIDYSVSVIHFLSLLTLSPISYMFVLRLSEGPNAKLFSPFMGYLWVYKGKYTT